MSIREEWLVRDALVVDGDRFQLRCRSTFSGTRLTDFVQELHSAIAGGLLEDAAHVEVSVATVGELWTAGELLAAVASAPHIGLRTLSLGALLGAPDLGGIEQSWAQVKQAFPALEHGPAACWRWAVRPRLRVVRVGAHFTKVRPNQVFELEKDGAGPWLALRDPAPGETAFDALALRGAVGSSNVTELAVSPLEPGDEVRVNGRLVDVHPLAIHRDGEVLRKERFSGSP